MQVKWKKTRHIMLLMAYLCCFTAVNAIAEQPVEDSLADTKAIIELLKQKGVFNEAEIQALEKPKDSRKTFNESLIELLKNKNIISENEAKAFEKYPGGITEQGPDEPVRKVAQQEEKSDEVVATKEDLQKVEENLKSLIDHSQVRSRRNEREITRLEERTLDSLAKDMFKTSWAKRISFGGDLRLRYQKDLFDENNYQPFFRPDDPDELMNSTKDRSRFRARFRLNMNVKLIDPREINVGTVRAGVRLTGGNEEDPISTNETLGDYFNRDPIVFDRYYLEWQYQPEYPIWDRIPQITLTGGRMPNPWFSTDLVWDEDLNFEGLAIKLKTDTLQKNKWHAFLTAGAFPLQETELNSDDKWLYGGQLGFEIEPSFGLRFKLGCAYYHYDNIKGRVNDPLNPGYYDYTAPEYQQMGNTLININPTAANRSEYVLALAADYRIVDVTALIDLGFFHPVHVMIMGDYAENIGFDRDEVSAITSNPDIREDNQAYSAGIEIGYPNIYGFGDWSVSFCYKYLERDAVLDAFTDSDFHLGGTNAEGWIGTLKYGLYKNVWLRARWLTADEIEDEPLAIDVLQVDINARF